MEVSGEVADLLVKEGLQVAELAAKLSAKGAVNAAVLTAALIKNNYKLAGQVGVERLNRDNAESVVISIQEGDMEKFRQLAKRFGVLYAAVNQEGSQVVHIISNVNYSAQLNAVLEAMGYAVPSAARAEAQRAKKAGTRAPQEKSSEEHGSGWRNTERADEPSVRKKLEELKTVAEKINAPSRNRGIDKSR